MSLTTTSLSKELRCPIASTRICQGGGCWHTNWGVFQLTFIPTSGTGGSGALGITNENGSFTVKHRSGKPGIEPGTYKVLFSQFVKPDGSPLGLDEDAATMGVERFPEKYQSPEQTPEQVTISATGEDSLLFEIKLK